VKRRLRRLLDEGKVQAIEQSPIISRINHVLRIIGKLDKLIIDHRADRSFPHVRSSSSPLLAHPRSCNSLRVTLQKGRHQEAANAAFTFLIRHRDHEMVEKSLRYYMDLPDVRSDNVVNLEAAPFVEIYLRGIAAYEEGNYAEAAAEFESSLASYVEAEEECRIYCEGPFDQGWHPEFTSSLASTIACRNDKEIGSEITRGSRDPRILLLLLLLLLLHFSLFSSFVLSFFLVPDHFAFCLKCKHRCSYALNNVNGNLRSDLLRSHYNYLQFAYYKRKWSSRSTPEKLSREQSYIRSMYSTYDRCTLRMYFTITCNTTT